ncbi:MAG: carboxypeptidase-like regulatory domain-containing protein [Pyrinomonadaceae bacterium]
MKNLIILLIFISTTFSTIAEAQCKKVKSNETTIGGGNMWITAKEDGVFKFISGKVFYPDGTEMEEALVEIFDNPDYILCDFLPNNPNNCSTNPPENQHRKVACKTGKDGTFIFKNLSAGKYEIRVSKGAEWNVFHDVIAVNPNNSKAKRDTIEITMSLGG